jgi:hypothetical protein
LIWRWKKPKTSRRPLTLHNPIVSYAIPGTLSALFTRSP